MNRKIQIVSTNPSAKKQTTTINYVNPNATDEKLRTMSTMMNALTNNTFNSATKIDTTELIAKVTPTITFNPTTASYADLAEAATASEPPYALRVSVTGNLGGVTPSFKIESNSSMATNGIILGGSANDIYMAYVLSNDPPTTNATITAYFPETSTYAAVEKTFVVTY